MDNAPTLLTDPSGQIKYKVPPKRLQDVRDAVKRLRAKLQEGCPSCAEGDTEKFLNLLDDPGFTIEYKENMADCGYSPIWTTLGLGKKIQISAQAWTCCIDQSLHGIDALASTILHEMAHRGQIIPTHSRPDELEAKCFGCQV